MTTLLISDLHLTPAAPEITAGFFAWLERNTQSPAELYILGDFFDAWIGDDLMALGDNDPTGHATLACEVARRLRAASERDARIKLMHGNRDFLLGEHFASAAGAELIGDPTLVKLGTDNVLLMHGDSLCTRDAAYMAFRAQARDPQWQAGILAMSIPERLALAQKLREQSGEANSNKAEDIMDVTPDEVIRIMTEQGVSTLIHGHTHRPDVHDINLPDTIGKRYVLGDWGRTHGWEIRSEPGQPLKLSRFAYEEQP
ncbi:UDP-2,3-diacylglucosamine diphosphatase [Halomonas binhaiensis]|uniref:UDP-2,3-diacylglucosamine hydrolase n=1 Tax=Halomonas binhaiensis TaxID=2562282 RepID=A0A5C1NIR7_9GAMM|nr:UDP-2,3-diacylglucosamine diphosphatase [Halomonas binhaiensis]QEM81639.1 UDP-2,3-diacylglucosamine diphosphatase [Halomonas binhaiensis]